MTLTKVWGWQADEGGCGYYRIHVPLSVLDGIDVAWGVLMPRAILDEEDRLIVLQRSTNQQAMMAMLHVKDSGRPWVYDIDDLLWGVEPQNPAYNYYQQEIVRDCITWQLRNAPKFVVSTPELAEESIDAGADEDRVVVHWNTIPQSVFDKVEEIQLAPRTDDRVTIFWRGSPTHVKDIGVLAYAVKKLGRRDDIRWVFAGTDYRSELKIPDAEFLPWVDSTEKYFEQVAAVQPDIVLCPLTHSRFNRSKSHVNALEGSMLGAIPVCSSLPAYQNFVHDAENGFIVPNSEVAWYKALSDLVTCPHEDLVKLKEGARANARRFTSELWKEQYRGILESVTS